MQLNANHAVPFRGKIDISVGDEVKLSTPTNDKVDRQFLRPLQRMLEQKPDSLKLAAGEETFYTHVGDGAVFCKKEGDSYVITTSNVMPFSFVNYKLTLNEDNTSFRVFEQVKKVFDDILGMLKERYKD